MPPSSRLAYIDWLRGLACLLMFQTHCYDAWLGGSARDSRFATWSHLGGTFPAPLFLFLAGISVALIADRMLQKGATASQVGKKVVSRGAEIFGLGLLFRVQEYAISWGWAPRSDLFRVDILNTIGLSIMLMGAMCWAVLASSEWMNPPLFREVSTTPGFNPAPQGRPNLAQDGSPGNVGGNDPSPVGPTERTRHWIVAVSGLAAAAISAFTPLLWTTWRLRFLPWEVESYINGVHNLGAPQPGLFPIFPWVGFAFAGLALGFVLMSNFSLKRGAWIFLLSGVAGVALIYASKLADSAKGQLYPVYDYWHTSPAFFTLRVGLLLVLVLGAYAWCRWGLGQFGFSPLIQFGRTSLLVYWVHIELVYGRFHILPPRSQAILGASKGLLVIFLLMLGLSLLRTTWKSRDYLPRSKPQPATVS